ncbi:unnamed protein product [Vitrella brassicaformis CCMP3155]|uniref:Uncharacterized protein n=1 Tax=Vitrella brassicaformis (strain CCMP3155) TaxID=1169540 RepID=A0A0G4GMH2_VITBC|nr:unnamed protein product [Vitrella brassicaformis CCMP3155]|eukprot:CEM31386.1 unnamed protein product [Vitrella brassicaformis CCMP3155]
MASAPAGRSPSVKKKGEPDAAAAAHESSVKKEEDMTGPGAQQPAHSSRRGGRDEGRHSQGVEERSGEVREGAGEGRAESRHGESNDGRGVGDGDEDMSGSLFCSDRRAGRAARQKVAKLSKRATKDDEEDEEDDDYEDDDDDSSSSGEDDDCDAQEVKDRSPSHSPGAYKQKIKRQRTAMRRALQEFLDKLRDKLGVERGLGIHVADTRRKRPALRIRLERKKVTVCDEHVSVEEGHTAREMRRAAIEYRNTEFEKHGVPPITGYEELLDEHPFPDDGQVEPPAAAAAAAAAVAPAAAAYPPSPRHRRKWKQKGPEDGEINKRSSKGRRTGMDTDAVEEDGDDCEDGEDSSSSGGGDDCDAQEAMDRSPTHSPDASKEDIRRQPMRRTLQKFLDKLKAKLGMASGLGVTVASALMKPALRIRLQRDGATVCDEYVGVEKGHTAREMCRAAMEYRNTRFEKHGVPPITGYEELLNDYPFPDDGQVEPPAAAAPAPAAAAAAAAAPAPAAYPPSPRRGRKRKGREDRKSSKRSTKRRRTDSGAGSWDEQTPPVSAPPPPTKSHGHGAHTADHGNAAPLASASAAAAAAGGGGGGGAPDVDDKTMEGEGGGQAGAGAVVKQEREGHDNSGAGGGANGGSHGGGRAVGDAANPIDLDSDKDGSTKQATGRVSAAAAAAATRGGVKKEEKDDVPRFKTVELSSLTNDDIVAIFMQDARLTNLVDTARTEEWDGETFAEVLETDKMNVQKAINEVLGNRITTGKVARIVRWLKRIDPNAVQVPLST